ncbi:hypothetical protein SAMN05216573_12395 [Bradyrhizobium sp. Rc3b]|nr:hypothetical protein SAMN05216573_12395 [Bradyrhizobium sp. Rc3b]
MSPNLPDPESALGRISTEGDKIVRPLMWQIRSIDACRRAGQLNVLGTTRPRWTPVMVAINLGKEKGAPVNLLSRIMHVDPSWVINYSKLLEKNGLPRHRKRCRGRDDVVDGGTRKHLAARQSAQDELAFDERDLDRSSAFVHCQGCCDEAWLGKGPALPSRRPNVRLSEMSSLIMSLPSFEYVLKQRGRRWFVVGSQRRRRAGDYRFRK